MDHSNKHGQSKLLKNCTLPLTGKRVVHKIITNLGVFDVLSEGLKVVEIAKNTSLDDIKKLTEATLVG
jgi:3-oxoacid CoA-transferase subunit B